jgi:hypothetical protein
MKTITVWASAILAFILLVVCIAYVATIDREVAAKAARTNSVGAKWTRQQHAQ